MNILKLFYLLITGAILFVNTSEAKEHPCSFSKRVPYLEKGCEGEACGFYHYNYALKNFKIYQNPDLKSKIMGEIKKCEHLKKIEPYYWRISFAKTKVLQANNELKKLDVETGDILTVKRYQGEGFQDVCIGQIEVGVEEGDQVRAISQGKTEEWVKVTNDNGLSGWIKREPETIMWAYTSDEAKKCSPNHKLKGL